MNKVFIKNGSHETVFVYFAINKIMRNNALDCPYLIFNKTNFVYGSMYE